MLMAVGDDEPGFIADHINSVEIQLFCIAWLAKYPQIVCPVRAASRYGYDVVDLKIFALLSTSAAFTAREPISLQDCSAERIWQWLAMAGLPIAHGLEVARIGKDVKQFVKTMGDVGWSSLPRVGLEGSTASPDACGVVHFAVGSPPLAPSVWVVLDLAVTRSLSGFERDGQAPVLTSRGRLFAS
jgi:hypothetical protein